MLELVNETTGQLVPFQPLGDPVTIYVCGITPYDTTHLGHAFTYLSFDVLIRYLEYLGHRVRYVQNVTDIDDDILRKAGETGEDWRALGNRWTRHFMEDLRALNVRPPDVYPRATEVITQMFVDIQMLIERGHAYVAEGNVYYAVASAPHFGQVSGLAPEQWLPIANERGNFPADPHKRDPLDFVLWQAQKPGEPAWKSPWGLGRPGWHIECTVMASAYLGPEIDIHGGGGDLAFPHHECETAQACGISGKEVFARHWLHTAMVRYQGEKMSKSLGNLIWARDLLREYSADTIRLLVTLHPYDETWEYDAAELGPAQALAERLLAASQATGGAGPALAPEPFVAAFGSAMDDSLDTRAALEALDDLARQIVSAAQAGQAIEVAQAALRRMGTVFGLRLGDPIEPRVLAGWDKHLQRFA
jgi:L-cysteine:1D-myo-inositol 2-amino-2-deoxy-alpha-D-glucopyranoside ligase